MYVNPSKLFRLKEACPHHCKSVGAHAILALQKREIKGDIMKKTQYARRPFNKQTMIRIIALVMAGFMVFGGLVALLEIL